MENIAVVLDQYRSITNTSNRTNTLSRPRKRNRADLLRDLGLYDPLQTFGNFELVAGAGDTYQAIRNIADGGTEATMFLCYGGTGSGKTHLLKAVALRLYGRGIFVRYLTWAMVINTLKNGLNDGAIPPYRDILRNYCYARALLIDDVGMGSTGTAFEYSQLEEIIDVRYSRRLLTLMATNKHLDELPDRVVSRLRDPDVSIVVLNSAKDYRIRQGNEN